MTTVAVTTVINIHLDLQHLDRASVVEVSVITLPRLLRHRRRRRRDIETAPLAVTVLPTLRRRHDTSISDSVAALLRRRYALLPLPLLVVAVGLLSSELRCCNNTSSSSSSNSSSRQRPPSNIFKLRRPIRPPTCRFRTNLTRNSRSSNLCY